jgi:hypothetical protein
MLVRRSGAVVSETLEQQRPPDARLTSELAREFLGTITDPRSPVVPAFTAWAAGKGLTVRDSKPVLAAVLRARVSGATKRFRNLTARPRRRENPTLVDGTVEGDQLAVVRPARTR